jgi:putative spermidine/putrescine transport system permease protein
VTRGNAPAAIASLFLASPVVIGVVYSTLAALGAVGAGADGLSGAAFARVLTSSVTWQGVVWTIATAGVATLVATLAAVVVAVRVADSRAGRLLAVLPMGVPHVAAALAALLMLGQSGLLSRLTRLAGLTEVPGDFPALVYDQAGVALVMAGAWKEFPYLALTALAVLLTDAARLDEVARTLGATSRQAFWRITWPRVWAGTAPAALAAFAFLLGQYEMPALLAPSNPTALALLTYERSIDPALARRAEAHVLALLGLVISASVVVAHTRLQPRVRSESR